MNLEKKKLEVIGILSGILVTPTRTEEILVRVIREVTQARSDEEVEELRIKVYQL